ncbi:MAG: HD-GYP domain-containing protein [Chloroflexi bacterium]|nr:HD-GYP domain-containing protein [Chloroflexota bacterium]
MRRSLPSVLPWAILIGASVVAFTLARSAEVDGGGWAWRNPEGHFWIVSAASLVCIVLALATGLAASRIASWRVTLVALSFIAMAGIFAVHGLATPGFILEARPPMATPDALPASQPAVAVSAVDDGYGGYASSAAGAASVTSRGHEVAAPTRLSDATAATDRYYNVTGASSRIAILAATGLLAAAALPWPARLEARLARRRRWALAAGVVAVLSYGAAALTAPWVVPTAIVESGATAFATTATVAGLGLFTAGQFATTYRRSGVELHGAIVIAALLLVQAQVSVQLGAAWSGTFWLYHLQLLAGFLALLWGVVIEYSRGRTLMALEALSVSDVLAQLRSGFTEPVIALSAALEARDGYTLGHGERVAALAVLIAQRMGVRPRRLRAIAAGSLLHDVGKIGVPDAILHKPDHLTPDEVTIIREHPDRGAEMLRQHFDQDVETNVIRYHHERWDGGGYPEGLAGTAIPLEARIVAVADVYDALRSNRAYRHAMDRDSATAIVRGSAGSQFDPACVSAFLAVVDLWETRHAAAAEQAYAERRAA